MLSQNSSNHDTMPLNNGISMPYYFRFLIENNLLNIQITKPNKSKSKAREPEQVNLVFPNGIIKNLIIKRYGLVQYARSGVTKIDAKLLADIKFGNELLIEEYDKLRKKSKAHKDEKKRKEDLAELTIKYCKAMRHHLATMVNDSLTVLLCNNTEEELRNFRQQCSTAATIEKVNSLNDKLMQKLEVSTQLAQSIYTYRVENGLIKPVSQLVVRTNTNGKLPSISLRTRSLSAQPGTTTTVKTPREGEESKSSTPSTSRNSTNLTINTTYSTTPYDTNREGVIREGEPDIELDQREGEPGEEYKENNSTQPLNTSDEGIPPSPLSPASPVSAYFPDDTMLVYMRECIHTPEVNTEGIDTTGLTCRISGVVCRVPVIAGDKVFDILSLAQDDKYQATGIFIDPKDGRTVTRDSLRPGVEIRQLLLARLEEKKFYEAFLIKYQEDYDNSYFKWGNFKALHKQGKIQNFDDLFRYIVDNPNSRSAKVFASMEQPLTNKFYIFMKSYIKDYQSTFFHRSFFLKEVKNQSIVDMETTRVYAEAPGHDHTRTARVFRSFPR